MKKILLLGGTGFLGSHLADRLMMSGFSPVVMGRRQADNSQYPVLNLDLSDISSILRTIETENVETVVHLASNLRPSSNIEAYNQETKDVSLPTFDLSRALARNGVKLVYLSSGGAIYGDSGQHFLKETDRCFPKSLYGQAKLECESHLSFLSRSENLRLLIIRPSNPFGPRQPSAGSQGLISVLLNKIANEEPLPVWGDGSAVRDYVYVEDAAAMISKLIEKDAEGIYNVGRGEGTSLLEIVRFAEQITGLNAKLVFHERRAGDVDRAVLDVGKIKSLGAYRSRPLQEGIRKFAEYLMLPISDVG